MKWVNIVLQAQCIVIYNSVGVLSAKLPLVLFRNVNVYLSCNRISFLIVTYVLKSLLKVSSEVKRAHL